MSSNPQPALPPAVLRDAGGGMTVPAPAGQLVDGVACRFNDECLSELCLERDGKPPICTRPCDTNADCRRGFTCFTWSGGARLCEAPAGGAVRDAGTTAQSSTAKDKSGGCDCAVGKNRSISGWGLLVVLAGIWGLRFRRRR